MIKLVAFDLDGTIGDTIPMCLKALKKAVTPYVTLNDVSENDILETFGLNEKGMIKKLVGYNWENALDDFYVIYEQMHIMCPRPFDGITELIEKLKKKSILIALVTGKGEKSCAITLRQFNMDTCFDKVKTGNPFKNNKAENFRELLADYKLQPDEMIYIGDTVSDIVSCREVGIRCLSASWITSCLDAQKLEAHNAGNGMHSACAFLNTEGGWLIFGIAPKSLKIIGQEVTDKTQQEIAQALAGLEPAVDVRVAYIDVPEHPGNKVIAMHFDGWVWGEHPHTFHGCPYFKVESTTKVMPQDMYDERIRAHQPQLYAWERLAADGVALADLDENLIRNSIRRGIDGGRIPESALYESTGDILSKWKLLKNGVPTNGAVLLFSNNIDEYPQFTLRMARFVGTNKNMFRDINVLKVISSNC